MFLDRSSFVAIIFVLGFITLTGFTESLSLVQWWVFSQSTGSCLSIVWERIVVQSWGKKVMGGRERAIASVHWNYQWSHRLIKSLRLCRERTRLRWLLWKFTAAKWSYTIRFLFCEPHLVDPNVQLKNMVLFVFMLAYEPFSCIE